MILIDRALPFHSRDTKSVSIRLTGSGDWGIFVDMNRIGTVREEYSVMLHEGGHYATGTTHEVCSPWDLVEKHEYSADKWAVEQAVTPEALDEAVADGCTELWQLAERFGVTDELMKKAVCWYTYGNLAADLYF